MTLRTRLLLAAALTFAAPAFAKPVIGQPAPDFSVTDASARRNRCRPTRARSSCSNGTIPNARSCASITAQSNMQEQQAAAARDGVVWLTVNSAADGKQGHLDAAGANAYVAKVGGKEAAYLLDARRQGRPRVRREDDAAHVRHRQGRRAALHGRHRFDREHRQGRHPKATQYVRQALAELEAGKAVSVPTSEPYGCSVKYGS